MACSHIVLELLDSGQGYPVQQWEFTADRVIHIGRSEECDVRIANEFVSRSHAYVRYAEGICEVVCLSRNGIFVDGQRRPQHSLTDGDVFRLAEKGPLLRFGRSTAAADRSDTSTVEFDPAVTPLLFLQQAERDRAVQEIVEQPYFQELTRKLSALRNRPES